MFNYLIRLKKPMRDKKDERQKENGSHRKKVDRSEDHAGFLPAAVTEAEKRQDQPLAAFFHAAP